MRRIFVCEGTTLSTNEKIREEATKMGKILADCGCTYVQGGSANGQMGLTLKEFLKYSKNVEFYIPAAWYDYDAPELIKLVGQENFKAHKTTHEAERLQAIISCDEVIVLPGGSGTIEELLFCNETKRAKEHNLTITLVNVNGIFNGTIQQMQDLIAAGLYKGNSIKWDVISSVDELQLSFNKDNELIK